MEYKNYTISKSDPKKTGLVIVSVEDKRTGFVVRTALPNSGVRTASIMAFAGARYSRSSLSAEELFQEIADSGQDANKKLASIFRDYGHSSVADMAMLFAYIENVPDCYHVEFFYDSRIGAGQVRSTRYQDFSKSFPPDISLYSKDKKVEERIRDEYQAMYDHLIQLNQKYIGLTEEAYKAHFEPDDSRANKSALKARVFDTARAFLPMGVSTSLAYITSAREWARMISVLKADERKMINLLGEQIEFMFAPPQQVMDELEYVPEAPDLIRHTQADTNADDAIQEACEFLTKAGGVRNRSSLSTLPREKNQTVQVLNHKLGPIEILMYQILLTNFPQLTIRDFHSIYRKISNLQKKRLSKLLFNRFNHHSQLGKQLEMSQYSFKVTGSYAELKDLNRHRAWAKFAPIWETDNIEQIVTNGYILPLYLRLAVFSDLRRKYMDDLQQYYERLYKFHESLLKKYDKRLVLNILPSSHAIDYYMHASPKEISYMSELRVRPGGHINYRVLAYLIAEEASKVDDIFAGLSLGKNRKPRPGSREEFFDRS